MGTVESDAPQDAIWLLACVAAVGLGVFLFGTEDGRKIRRQLLSWTEEAQRRLADVQELLAVTRQLCEGELPDESRDSSAHRLRAVQGG